MKPPDKQIPEPILPEHQMLRHAGPLPQLSSGFRERVLADIRRRVVFGRWMGRLKTTGVVLAASLMVGLIWNYRGSQTVSELAPTTESRPMGQAPLHAAGESLGNGSLSGVDDFPAGPVSPAVPQGGPSSRRDAQEMPQLNRLIEDIRQRHDVFCGMMPRLNY